MPFSCLTWGCQSTVALVVVFHIKRTVLKCICNGFSLQIALSSQFENSCCIVIWQLRTRCHLVTLWFECPSPWWSGKSQFIPRLMCFESRSSGHESQACCILPHDLVLKHACKLSIFFECVQECCLLLCLAYCSFPLLKYIQGNRLLHTKCTQNNISLLSQEFYGHDLDANP